MEKELHAQSVEQVRLVVGVLDEAHPTMEAEVRLDLSSPFEGQDLRDVLRTFTTFRALLERKSPQEVEAWLKASKPAPQPQERPVTNAALHPLDAPDKPFKLKKETVIGRSRVCDLSIKSARVSRRHMRILETEAGFVVEDLQSANRTWVNGNEVLRHKLEDGDIISVGDVSFQYQVAA